jgi:hypothetical protein
VSFTRHGKYMACTCKGALLLCNAGAPYNCHLNIFGSFGSRVVCPVACMLSLLSAIAVQVSRMHRFKAQKIFCTACHCTSTLCAVHQVVPGA